MENIQVQTAQNVAIGFEVAGLGDRVIAALIDYILIGFYYIGLSIVAAAAAFPPAVLILLLLPPFLYFLLCEIFMDGQSIGKRLRAIKVARLGGRKPTLGSYLLRWLLRPIDLLMTLGAAAVITILINGKGQRLGDLAAGTTVVKLRQRTALHDTPFTPVDDHYQPTFHQVDRLSYEDITTAREVLNTLAVASISRTTNVLGSKMKATLEHKMGVTSDLSPHAFLKQVMRDYNHLHGRGF